MGSIPETLLVADLQTTRGNPPIVSFYDLESFSITQDGQSVFSGYYHVRDEHNQCYKSADIARYSKAVAKGTQLARKAVDVFNNKGEQRAASMSITSSGLVGGPPCEGHALNVEGITFFAKTLFLFPALLTKTRDMVSTQYLHFSSPTPQIISQIVSSKRDSLKLQNLTIVSGVCLFSMRALQSSIDKCRGINVKRLQNIGPTLYEMEYIARSAPVIADLAVLLGETGRRSKNGNSRAQSNRPLTLCLDVPSFHYYQSVDDCLQSHSCTFQEALQWLNAVEKRHEQISHIFRSYINHELSRRCGSSEVCDIRVSPAANLVCSTIHDALARGTRPSLHHVLHMLNEKEPAWATFFRLVPEKEKPHDFRSLGYLFYVFHVVRQALIGNNDETCGHGNDILSVDGGDAARLLISVDDSVERRVYSRAQKILKKIRASHEYPVTPNLLEVYLCRRVFIDGNAKGSNLYLDDPSPELMAPEAPRSVHTYTRHDAPSKSSGLNSLAVVKRIYGADTAAILQELCAEVGLHA